MKINNNTENRILLNSGLNFVIDRYVSPYNIYGHFEEDPGMKKIVTKKMLDERRVEHTNISDERRKSRGFLGCLDTKFICRSNNLCWYETKCNICGKRWLETPSYMEEHKREHGEASNIPDVDR